MAAVVETKSFESCHPERSEVEALSGRPEPSAEIPTEAEGA
jgi:hypothetical protein